jgi:Lon protease-like protein
VQLLAVAFVLLALHFQPAQRNTPTALPSEIPLFPLPEVALFPDVTRPFLIFEPRYREMIADALKGDRIIGMVLLQPGYEKDYEGRPPIRDVGCAGVIEKCCPTDDTSSCFAA